MHRISAAPARPSTRGRDAWLLSLPFKGARWSTKSLEFGGRNSLPRSSPFCPGLDDDDATFGSKSFLRSRLVRSLRGSTSSSTERSTAPVPGDVTRQDSDQPSTGRANDTEALSTVAEEDLEDWVDDFEAISLSDVPGVVDQAESVAGSSGASQSSSSESDSTHSSRRTKQSQSQPQPQPRQRTTSKTSRRSRQSSRRETELRLILDFPLPPTFIPTPPTTRTPPPSRPPAEVAPVNDDESIFYDNDPFRAKPIRDQDAAAEVASQSIAETGAPRGDSSASFYTAHSRSSSPVPSSHILPPPSLHPSEQQQQPPLSPLQLPFPDPSLSSSPQLSHSATLSTSRRSVRTLTKASATLKRLGNRTRETLLTSFRAPRPRRATRVKHVSLEHLPHSSHHLTDPRPVLPDFHPEAFDISFPAVETPRTSPRPSRVRVARSQPSVQSFYASLEEFLTSHLHSDELNRRSRFKSAPTLLLTSDRDPPSKPVEAPSAEVEVVPPTPPLLPRTERPLPPLPREAYQFVDPSTLTKSASVSPASGHRRSSLPPSPSWLSRNVRELEVALAKRLEASSVASSRSAWGSDTEEVSTIHLPKAVQTQTPSPSTTSSSTRLRGEVVRLRGRVNIQDTTPRQITLRSLTSSNKTPSEATVVLRTRSRSRRNRSGHPSQPRLVISTVPPNPPVRPRSRTSSVTKATITHYRRSLLETRKKTRPRKEDSAKFAAGIKVPKARRKFSI
ncbi:hypothetical protein F5888DRAFT_1902277, partial [Russula emetica]